MDLSSRPRAERGDRASGRGPLLGVVACGGASSRMGYDKARLMCEGEMLVVRTARALAARTAEVALASGAPRFGDVPELAGVTELSDASRGSGPLAGLVSALEYAAERRFGGVLYVGCDLVRVDEDVLAPLARALQEGADVAYWTSDAGPEPLCAAISAACAPVARAAFERGVRRMIEPWVGAGLDVRELPAPAEIADRLVNANTPEDGRRLGLDLPTREVAS